MALHPDKSGLLWINDLTGGLNDTDAPQDLAPNQCSIAQNVEWVTTRFAQRRQGGTNGIHATEPWGTSATLFALMRHTPTANVRDAELWAVDNSSPTIMARLAAGNQFVAVTVGDAWTVGDQRLQINGVTLNGKLFIAGDTAQDRLHVWDGSTFRRVGLATPAAPTVANTGAGAYPATLRYYKVQWVNLTGFPASRSPKSELGAAVSFTPSGAGTAARVTRPTAPGEGETDWILFGSPDGVNYYLIAVTAIATTTFDDTVNPATYATVFPTVAGYPTQADYWTPPISAKYLLADEDRLILLSSWETASMASAVMWTPVIGTTPTVYNTADEERVPSGNRLDVDRQHGGGITGGALWNGSLWVFKQSAIYELIRTGDVNKPYRPGWKTTTIGALSHKSIVVGEDDRGASALYFLSERGPYRLSQAGLEYCGKDIETFWKTVNYTTSIPAFGEWYPEKRQVLWWLITGAATLPDKVLVLHARHAHRDDTTGDVRGGLAVHTDGKATALCAAMFANTLGATMSLDLKPYVGQIWTSGLPDGPCIKYDADGTYTDRGGVASTYIARVKTGAFPPGGPGMKGSVTQPYVLGTPANRELALDLISDFNAETRSGELTLPVGTNSPTRVLVKVEADIAAQDAMYVELVVDDDVSPASSAAWTVDAVGLRLGREAQI